MFNSKYSNVLTMILIILIVGILGVIGYFAYDLYSQYTTNSNAQSTVSEFQKAVSSVKKDTTNTTEEDNNTTVENPISLLNTAENSNVATTEQNPEVSKTYMEGYEVLGTIKIPKTGVEYPILSEVTKRTLEIAVGVQWPVDLQKLNEPGNTVILGHNYRNGLFFSNNKKLTIGDKINITDSTGTTVTYTIYNMYETSANDIAHITRDIGDGTEISLQTCTDDAKNRLIICAKVQ